MAITGQGTQSDPYIVHNYSEIKSTTAAVPDGLTYMKLANDIDCNDYGEGFEWESCTPSYTGNKNIDFDLNGHVIKNIKVKAGNVVFATYDSSKIHDGEILNIFTPDAIGVARSFGGDLSIAGPTFKNISMSASGTGCTESMFLNCKFDSCAVYIEKAFLNEQIFNYSVNASNAFKNSDFKIIVNNMNEKSIFAKNNGYGVSFTMDSCRITGACKGKRCNGALVGDGGIVISSVVDMDFSLTTAANGGIYAQNYIEGSSGSGVFNIDTTPDYYQIGGLTPVTSAQIINGDALRGQGFVVVNAG